MRTRYRHAEHSASGVPGAVTVVGLHESSPRARQPDGSIHGWVAMEEYAAVIENLTSLRVTRLPLADCTETDIATATMAASVVSTLGHRGISPSRGRVILACPERAPLLGPVLIECGVGSVTSWSNHDAQDFSLRRLLTHNDVLVDLSDSASRLGGEIEGSITLGSNPVAAVSLALTGLLDALNRRTLPRVDARVLAACARALNDLETSGLQPSR
ncbi:hypothetical protein [Rhodococcus sp. BP22]|uniref:hypothetical protein n=1 Tax=Rhodococcus sp. BP22 TaxID=2758566 RepID=UPI001644E294|nr:hypothetical protein [Rhodococcus sp. BP22]